MTHTVPVERSGVLLLRLRVRIGIFSDKLQCQSLQLSLIPTVLAFRGRTRHCCSLRAHPCSSSLQALPTEGRVAILNRIADALKDHEEDILKGAQRIRSLDHVLHRVPMLVFIRRCVREQDTHFLPTDDVAGPDSFPSSLQRTPRTWRRRRRQTPPPR